MKVPEFITYYHGPKTDSSSYDSQHLHLELLVETLKFIRCQMGKGAVKGM